MSQKIFVNGEIAHLDELGTLQEILEILQHQGRITNSPSFAVAINGNFVPRSEYTTNIICDADRLEIVVPQQGG